MVKRGAPICTKTRFALSGAGFDCRTIFSMHNSLPFSVTFYSACYLVTVSHIVHLELRVVVSEQ